MKKKERIEGLINLVNYLKGKTERLQKKKESLIKELEECHALMEKDDETIGKLRSDNFELLIENEMLKKNSAFELRLKYDPINKNLSVMRIEED